jgi:hypothetical protein
VLVLHKQGSIQLDKRVSDTVNTLQLWQIRETTLHVQNVVGDQVSVVIVSLAESDRDPSQIN